MTGTWQNAGLRLSDEGLYSQGLLTHAEKVVLAAMLSPTARDETVAQLADRLPYSREQLQDARAALQRKAVLRLSPVVRLPPPHREREIARRGRSVVWVDPRFDNRTGHSVYIPGEAVAAVTAVSARGATPALLLLMLYARMQARKKAVYVRDSAACADLGLSMKQIKGAKHRLRAAGLLTQVGTKGGTPISVLPFMPSDPDSLIWERTLTHTTREEAVASKAAVAAPTPLHDPLPV